MSCGCCELVDGCRGGCKQRATVAEVEEYLLEAPSTCQIVQADTDRAEL